jgi:hypothetical protein
LRRIDDATKELNVLTTAANDKVETLFNQELTCKLIQWVAPEKIDPDESYDSALRLRQKETGKWFLESAQFENFLTSNGGLFWIYGNRKTSRDYHLNAD